MAFRKTLAAFVALGALGAVAAPAAAQDRYYDRYERRDDRYERREERRDDRYERRYGDRYERVVGPWLNYPARAADLDRRIEQSYRVGRLDGSEASRLGREVEQFERLSRDLARGGWTQRDNEIANERYQRLNRYLDDVARRPVRRAYERRDHGRW